jgi:hypothetical protein
LENKAAEAIFGALQGHPVWIVLTAFVLILLYRGPAYISAISSARSQKRRDDVELAEKERKLQSRIEARKREGSKQDG